MTKPANGPAPRDDANLDAFFAEADDIIDNWNPDVDAGEWRSDGGHQPEEIEGDYYLNDRPPEKYDLTLAQFDREAETARYVITLDEALQLLGVERPWILPRADRAYEALRLAALDRGDAEMTRRLDDAFDVVKEAAWRKQEAFSTADVGQHPPRLDAVQLLSQPVTAPVGATEAGSSPVGREPHWLGRRPHAVPIAVAVCFLVGSLGGHPYSYFQLLRLVVCAAAIVVVVCVIKWRDRFTANRARAVALGWTAAAIAVLFNPIIPIYLTRSTWLKVDLLVAFLLGATAFVLQRPANVESKQR